MSQHDSFVHQAAPGGEGPAGGPSVSTVSGNEASPTQQGRMNPEIKAKWVAALRSGEYKQTKKQLRAGDSFCCLGVLCNLHAQEHPQIAAQQTRPDEYMYHTGLAPFEVLQWAGLAVEPTVKIESANVSLSSHNDGEWKRRPIPARNFLEIADAIESQL